MGAAILGSAGNVLLLLLFVVVCLFVVVAPLPSGVGRGWVAGRGCRWLGAWVCRRLDAWGVPIDRARQAASIRRLERGTHSNPENSCPGGLSAGPQNSLLRDQVNGI